MNVMLREFGRYIADPHRTDLFRLAIEELVRPGDVVVDLGTGFGLLALLAARQGAHHVYAIEQAQYIELARDIAADNGLSSRITFLHGNSAMLELPQRADVLVAELLGQFALEEFIVEYVSDAARRFLKPGGHVIPSEVRLWLTPVEMPGLRRRWSEKFGTPWSEICGFDFRRLQSAVLLNELSPYVVQEFGAGDRKLGERALAARFNLPHERNSKFCNVIRLTIGCDGILDGFLGTFEAQLSPSVRLSTGVEEPSTHWGQVVFPLFPGQAVVPGKPLEVEISFLAGGGWRYLFRSVNP
jgi:2-polyprenyl-3-methyl-5-hydroxy-6-metoxy-1,4-benzoquinol methylase